MFEHPLFDHYAFETIPLNEELYLVDEAWAEPYDKSLQRVFAGGDYSSVGYVSYAVVKSSDESRLELSWYPNTYDRFHEVQIALPREVFVACVGSWRWDEIPRIFVKSGWIERLHRRLYSAFALVDVSDFKKGQEYTWLI